MQGNTSGCFSHTGKEACKNSLDPVNGLYMAPTLRKGVNSMFDILEKHPCGVGFIKVSCHFPVLP